MEKYDIDTQEQHDIVAGLPVHDELFPNCHCDEEE